MGRWRQNVTRARVSADEGSLHSQRHRIALFIIHQQRVVSRAARQDFNRRFVLSHSHTTHLKYDTMQFHKTATVLHDALSLRTRYSPTSALTHKNNQKYWKLLTCNSLYGVKLSCYINTHTPHMKKNMAAAAMSEWESQNYFILRNSVKRMVWRLVIDQSQGFAFQNHQRWRTNRARLHYTHLVIRRHLTIGYASITMLRYDQWALRTENRMFDFRAT